MLNPTYLETNIKKLMGDNLSTREVARRMAQVYAQYAIQANITPVILPSKTQALATAILSGLTSRNMKGFLSSLDTGLGLFWLGTVVPGGTVTAYAGSSFIRNLSKTLRNGIPTREGARQLALGLDAATRTVLYVIPPAGPLPLT